MAESETGTPLEAIDSHGWLGYHTGMTGISEACWFVIQTRPKQEFVAERNLKILGAETYLPLYYARVKVNKEKVPQLSTLFKGYIFARFSINSLYHKVRYCRGVKNVLGGDNGLWTIDDDRIRSIRNRERDGVVVLQKKSPVFSPGDSIRIDEGDFDGWEGVFCEELPDRERAMILLTNVRFSSKLIVPKRFLVAGS